MYYSFISSSVGTFLKQNTIQHMPQVLLQLHITAKLYVLYGLIKQHNITMLLSMQHYVSLIHLSASRNTEHGKGYPFQLFPTQLTTRKREEQ